MNTKASDGATPIFIATYANKVEAVKALLTLGADINNFKASRYRIFHSEGLCILHFSLPVPIMPEVK